MPSLEQMRKEWKKINESSKDQYGSGTVGPLSTDTNSKPTKDVGRPEGSKAGRTETGDGGSSFEASKGSPGGTPKPVSRKEGSKAGRTESGEGQKTGTDTEVSAPAKRVARKEGSAAGKSEVGEYGDLTAFRNNLRAKLGLPSGINEPNKGLNK